MNNMQTKHSNSKVAPLPDTLEGVSVGDIPIKFYDKKRLLPHSSQVHAHLFHFRRALAYCNNISEIEAGFYKKKLSALFVQDETTERCLPTLSVRSSFDMYLQVRKFPKGSEILMTAITIPDMVKIAEEHGLVVVPLDVEPDTLAPRMDQVRAATSSLTVACVFAHVFGLSYSLDPYVEFLNSRGIEMIEDCAQAF